MSIAFSEFDGKMVRIPTSVFGALHPLAQQIALTLKIPTTLLPDTERWAILTSAIPRANSLLCFVLFPSYKEQNTSFQAGWLSSVIKGRKQKTYQIWGIGSKAKIFIPQCRAQAGRALTPCHGRPPAFTTRCPGVLPQAEGCQECREQPETEDCLLPAPARTGAVWCRSPSSFPKGR